MAVDAGLLQADDRLRGRQVVALQALDGVRRFLDKLWLYATETRFESGDIEEVETLRLLHQKVHKVTRDLERLHYNTAVAALMELRTGLQEARRHHAAGLKTLLQLTAPFAPFITQELWSRLDEEGQICDAPWPVADEEHMQEELVEWVIQINGKVRDRLELAVDSDQTRVEAAAFDSPRVKALVEGKEVVKIVFVPGKLLNVVVR